MFQVPKKTRGNDPGPPQTAEQQKVEIDRIVYENYSDNDANVNPISDQERAALSAQAQPLLPQTVTWILMEMEIIKATMTTITITQTKRTSSFPPMSIADSNV
jgi:hypothetical protein